MKPVESATTDLYAPEKQAARTAINDKYSKAIASGPSGKGALRTRVDAASTDFDRTASDMLGRLDAWVKKLSTGPVHDLLEQRKAVAKRIDDTRTATLGTHEKARDDALAVAKNWAARFADWSAPDATIDKIVSAYADQINKLNSDINNGVAADAAILSFWAEIAPKHLQVSDVALSADAAKAVKTVKDALTAAKYDDLAATLDPATTRDAGGVYVIPAGPLDAKRKSVLASWTTAANTLADAQVTFKFDPDDAATLRQASDRLGGDAWIKEAKAALTPSAAA
jgi:hypothetical protein